MLKFCPKCGKTYQGDRCPCTPRPKRKPTPGDRTRAQREPWRKAYKDPEYQRNRQLEIDAAKGRCRDCGAVCARHVGGRWTTAGLGGEVDHVVPLREGGGNNVENLALRCKSCHGRKDARLRKKG